MFRGEGEESQTHLIPETLPNLQYTKEGKGLQLKNTFCACVLHPAQQAVQFFYYAKLLVIGYGVGELVD